MSTWAIGDIQGCYGTLAALLARIEFAPGDRVWLVGDLVGRGPRPLEVLRWVQDLGDRAVVVLGNHDLNLLAVHAGVREARAKDRFESLLEAADLEEHCAWLASRPLVHREGSDVLVHAGLLPQWSVARARERAAEAGAMLVGPDRTGLLAALQQVSEDGDEPLERAAFALKALTALRVCTAQGEVDFAFKGPPGEAPAGYRPWFSFERPAHGSVRLIFGHWSALGRYLAPGLAGLDSGCVWGRALTALRLEDGAQAEEPCHSGESV